MAIGKLTALDVKRKVDPGRYGDGGGLYLQVRDADCRSWLFRYKLHGCPRQMGLGPLHDVTLAEARESAQRCRKMVRDKIDPIDQRRLVHAQAAASAAAALTFRQVAERYIATHEAGWKNPRHAAQWPSSLEMYVYPTIGDRPVTSITTGDVTRILEPIWNTKSETATRVRGRMEVVLDYAKIRGWRAGENPARWKGHLEHALPARSKVAKVEHHAALPWAEMQPFMAALAGEEGASARALQLTILTAARTSEALGARWSEVDLAAKVWTIPADRMKAGVEHRVPLSDAAVAVLETMAPLKASDDGFVFPGAKAGKELSNMAMAMLLRRMGRVDLTVYGFRSSFRDWAAETTGYPGEVVEAALAHTVGSKVEAAYRRGDLFEKRRRLMDDWATFCAQMPREAGSNVIALHQSA